MGSHHCSCRRQLWRGGPPSTDAGQPSTTILKLMSGKLRFIAASNDFDVQALAPSTGQSGVPSSSWEGAPAEDFLTVPVPLPSNLSQGHRAGPLGDEGANPEVRPPSSAGMPSPHPARKAGKGMMVMMTMTVMTPWMKTPL